MQKHFGNTGGLRATAGQLATSFCAYIVFAAQRMFMMAMNALLWATLLPPCQPAENNFDRQQAPKMWAYNYFRAVCFPFCGFMLLKLYSSADLREIRYVFQICCLPTLA